MNRINEHEMAYCTHRRVFLIFIPEELRLKLPLIASSPVYDVAKNAGYIPESIPPDRARSSVMITMEEFFPKLNTVFTIPISVTAGERKTTAITAPVNAMSDSRTVS